MTLAYIAGMLFGKSSRGFFRVSPNKSIAGFIGGFSGSLAAAIAAYKIAPAVFGNSFLFACIAGIATGISTIAGDIVESSMKRSAGLKDSGTVMLGRGGVLDSTDSSFTVHQFLLYCFVLHERNIAYGACF